MLEDRMKKTLRQMGAIESMLKTLKELGIMSPYLVLGELREEEPMYSIVVRIVGQSKIYRIEVVDDE